MHRHLSLAVIATLALPLAPPATAAGSDDLRIGVAFGVATDSEFKLESGPTNEGGSVDDAEPRRLTLGYMHRFAAADASGVIVGLQAFRQEGPSGLDDPIGIIAYDLETTAFGFDLVAGYALLLPPRVRLEGFAFGGYLIEQMQLRSDSLDYSLTGDGWEAGVGVNAFYALGESWDIGLDLRWLLLHEATADFAQGDATLEMDGLLAGLVLCVRI